MIDRTAMRAVEPTRPGMRMPTPRDAAGPRAVSAPEVRPGAEPPSDLHRAFTREVGLTPAGRTLLRCLQCGVCTGSCPVAPLMDITPRRAIALVRAGELEALLRSNTVWICASCYACTVRCPAGIAITDILYAVKRLAMERREFAPATAVHRLSKAFMHIVSRHGRNREARLVVTYRLRTQPLRLLADMRLGFRLRRRGRLPWHQPSVEGRKEFTDILGRAKGRSTS
jgi:heterodisulfide reductase subunit C